MPFYPPPPGRPGWLPTRGSHRSGRAPLTHPARRAAAWRAAVLPAAVACTDNRGTMPPAGVPTAAPRLGAPFPPRAPRGASSPASVVLWDAPTPCLPLAALRFLRLAIPHATPVLSLPAAQTSSRGPGVGNPVAPAGKDVWRGPGSLRFLGDPLRLGPVLGPRQDRAHQARYGVAAWPPRVTKTRAPTSRRFRGSLAEPQRWLSTLRRVGRPTTTQDSLPVAGPSLSGRGLLTRRVPAKGFRDVSYIPSSFPKLS